MLESLREEEIETAAKSSYRYFLMTRSPSSSSSQNATATATAAAHGADDSTLAQVRDEMAMAMARRYLVGEKGDAVSALAKMKATIQYRDEINVDAMRRCCYEPCGDDDDDDDKTALTEMRTMVDRQLLRHGSLFLRGYDKKNCVVYHIKVAGAKQEMFHPVDFVRSHVYLGDRASACTERRSGNVEEHWTTVIDYHGYGLLSLNPPLRVAKDLVTCLQDHFPERLNKIYLVDAPLLFRGFWNLIKPFIDPVTKAKLVFVTGKDQKEKMFSDVIDTNQAMPFMIPEGSLTEPVDMKKFLYETPYEYAYGEEIDQ